MKIYKDYVPTYKTCEKLKSAGWTEPTLFAYSADGTLFMVTETEDYNLDSGFYAPMLQEIIDDLPDVRDIQGADGTYSIKINHTIDPPIYGVSENINEAGAFCWLELKKRGNL